MTALAKRVMSASFGMPVISTVTPRLATTRTLASGPVQSFWKMITPLVVVWMICRHLCRLRVLARRVGNAAAVISPLTMYSAPSAACGPASRCWMYSA